MPANICPECVQGKHRNCITETLNDADQWVPCQCEPCATAYWDAINEMRGS